MRNIKNMVKGAAGTLTSFACMGLAATQALAATDTDAVVKSVTEGSGNGTFDSLISKLTAVGSDAYTLAITICIIGLLLSLVIVGLTLVTSKNANKREESKSWIFWVAVGAAIVFGAGALTEILIGIGTSFTSAGAITLIVK